MQMMTHCHECGGRLFDKPITVMVSFGKRAAAVNLRGQFCEGCGATYHNPSELEQARREAIDRERIECGLLTPCELASIRARLGITQWQMERVLRVGANTVVRWERGTVFQNPAVDGLIRVIAEVPGAYVFLANLVDLHARLPHRLS